MAKLPQQAIAEFVEAVAQHYLRVQSESSHRNGNPAPEEFVSEIETDLKSTLRHRLNQLETRATAESPTLDLPASQLDVDRSRESLELDGPTETEEACSRVSSAADQPTLDTSAGSSANAPTIESAGVGESSSTEIDHRDSTNRIGSDVATSDSPEDYEILGKLGKGGMGVVYKARHIPLNRIVAVKMILSGAHASADQLARFQREAESAARLKHPNIVAVYEVGKHNGMPFFSQEYIEGKSVADLMLERTLSAREAAELLIPVARAVHYSHQMGVLHRDLKPQNILLDTDGKPKVTDFGLAKRLDADGHDDQRTREGVIIGTPGYIAPEQARQSDEIGPPTDVYALGCILYYLMTGRPPFKAPTPFETVRQSDRKSVV